MNRRRFLQLSVGAAAAGLLPVPGMAEEKLKTRARVLIIGGGAAGIAMANRFAQSLDGAKITVAGARIPHIYQPGLTLVASGLWEQKKVVTATSDWLPEGITWIRHNASEFDPDNKTVQLMNGQKIPYDILIVAPGCQLNYQEIEGMSPALIGQHGIGSVYAGPEAATKTYQMIRSYINKNSGQAIFTLSNTPIKCAGAPLKLTFLMLDHLEKTGRRENYDVRFVSPYDKKVFSIPYYNDFVLKRWQQQQVGFLDNRVLTAIDGPAQKATFTQPDGVQETLDFDFIHVVPPMSAPDAIRNSELVWQEGSMAGNWVEVDQYSMQHRRYPEVFAIGDVAGTPFGKTAASVKLQAPVVEANVRAFLAGSELTATYDGYTSCPLITAVGKAVLVEFGYGGKLLPSFPFISPKEESWLVWMMKEKMLQPAYYAMLHGAV
ncbi:Pyridine nucleotide-disulfide oxidoreductase [Vibrio quintilis]|uniref:Pyridine nucleotide-disulfide oxidoreductase n=2 Tax=Vibrio quintilis TaxID=1117707 RepID=A0A1M7YR21_9VIBR|nr:Pyridine nucleotide-disulfide oxidoreductase [Vibrio quintilis]